MLDSGCGRRNGGGEGDSKVRSGGGVVVMLLW